MPSIRPVSCLFRSSRGTGTFNAESSSSRGQQDSGHEDAPSSQPVTAGSPHNTQDVPAHTRTTGPAGQHRRRQLDHCMPSGNWRALVNIHNRAVAGIFQRRLEGSLFFSAPVSSRPGDHPESSGIGVLTALQVVSIRRSQTGGIHRFTLAARCFRKHRAGP
jgi:hypothetical protein